MDTKLFNVVVELLFLCLSLSVYERWLVIDCGGGGGGAVGESALFPISPSAGDGSALEWWCLGTLVNHVTWVVELEIPQFT